jgi:TIR domain
VRCWFTPEDMKIGDKILDKIDEAIRLRDKVLIILSKASLESDWVEDEVTKAFSEERQRGQTVLFPIRIDDTVFNSHEPWAAKLRDNRHIGDFSGWRNRNAYRTALDQLVRHLRVGGATPLSV